MKFGRVVKALAVIVAGVVTVPALPDGPAEATLSGMPAGFVDEVVVGGLPYPTAIAFAPDDTMFIALKAGIVRVYRNGQLLATPFINISSRVHDDHDKGLLGITVHPQFPLQPYLYVLYTHDPPGVYPDGVDPDASGNTSTPARTNQLMRVEADPATGYTTAKAGTETVLLGANGTRDRIGLENDGRNISAATCMSPKTPSGTPVRDCIPSDEDSHSIGTVAFAPDGSLFVSTGDGSNYVGVDPRALRSQNLDSLAGKVLRIDPVTGNGMPDNPFYQASDPGSNRSKVWARGLRNPFRLTVNPTTGEPFVGDVGWNNWEEINSGKGANFGWPCYEGGTADPGDNESGDTASIEQFGYKTNSLTSTACAALYGQGLAAVKAPVYTYNHTAGQGSATSGGAFYTGDTYPAQYRGALFIADYNDRWIRYLTFDGTGRATKSNFGTDPSFGPVQLITGPDTNIYWMRYDDNGGEVRRLRYVGAGNTPPVAEITATPTIGITPLTVEFNSDQSYDPDGQPLQFRWDFGDGTTSTTRNPTHTYTQAGVYDARLTITEQTSPFAVGTSTVRITVGSNPPLVTIETPTEGDTYRVGDTIPFRATAAAGGTPMPADSMTWQLRTHHNEHVHFDNLPSAADPNNPNRSQGSFVAQDHGDSVFYEVCVTATVSEGVTDNQCANLEPEKVQYTLRTEPAGLQLVYEDEGIAVSSPAIIEPVVGSVQTVTVEPIQQHLSFIQWSDGVTERSRTFTVESTPQTFTAIYQNLPPTAVITPPSPAGQAPLTVNFDGSDSSDPEGDALTYAWSTSDGRTATGTNPSWSFATPGTYTVTLTVTDQLGQTGTSSVTVQATEDQLPPAASFTATPTSGRAPLAVALDGRASSDPEGGPLTYAWSASTGQTASGAQTSITFTEAGTHTVTLTVTDNAGATGTASTEITVDPPPPPGLVAAFGFDEGSGNSVTDASGSGNNGTVSGATRITGGRYGGALSFDGTNDSVSVPDANSLDLTNNLTLSAWVRPGTGSGWRTVLLKERPGGLAYGLYGSGDVPRPSGQLVIGSAEQQLISPSALPANTWSHLAFTYNGSAMRLYINGVEVADLPQTGNAVVSTGALKIGGNAIWGEWFNGQIDEVRIYNRALTPAQLQADMAAPVTSGAAPTAETLGTTQAPTAKATRQAAAASADDPEHGAVLSTGTD